MKNIKTIFKLFLLANLFHTTSFTAARSFSDQTNKFARNYIHTGSCAATCLQETDPSITRKMQTAECIICIGACCCAASGYGTIVCVETPAAAFVLGSLSGCAGSAALHQAGGLAQKIYHRAQLPQIYVETPSATMPTQEYMTTAPDSRSSRVAQLLQQPATPKSPQTSATQNPLALIRQS